LLAAFGEINLPRNVYFADGSPIDSEMLDDILRVCDEHSVVFSWNEGDVLLLDNMLTAHGRKPFVGKRKVVVGMAEANQTIWNSSLWTPATQDNAGSKILDAVLSRGNS